MDSPENVKFNNEKIFFFEYFDDFWEKKSKVKVFNFQAIFRQILSQLILCEVCIACNKRDARRRSLFLLTKRHMNRKCSFFSFIFEFRRYNKILFFSVKLEMLRKCKMRKQYFRFFKKRKWYNIKSFPHFQKCGNSISALQKIGKL